MEKPKIGQILFLVETGNLSRRYEGEYYPVEVVKVGQKYFTIAKVNNPTWKQIFHIEDWKEKTDFSISLKLFETEQACNDHKEKASLISCMRNTFYNMYTVRDEFTLEQLREAAKILGLEPKND